MTLPTYENLCIVDSLATIEAALLESVSDAGVTSWATESPQFGLLAGEAEAMRVFQVQRLILAYTASPRQLTRLRAKLLELGFTADDAAAIATSWVDTKLSWYGADFARIPAQKAEWTIGVKVSSAAAPLTIDGSTQGFFQADDGTIFEFAQDAAVTLNSGSSYKGAIRVRARTAGSSGNVVAGTITQARGPAGLSVDLTVTQVLSFAGRDAETDEAAVARAEARWGTLGAGWTLEAFDYWIPTTAPSLTRWLVDDANPLGPGTTKATLATDAGPASDDEVAAIQAKMGARDVRALGSSTFLAEKATVHTLSITATIAGNGSNPDLKADAEAALVALAKAFPLGPAKVVVELVNAVLMGAAIDTVSIPTGSTSKEISPRLAGFTGWKDTTALSMAADEDLAYGEVLRISPNVTVV